MSPHSRKSNMVVVSLSAPTNLQNDASSKAISVYDAIPENEISNREDTHVGQLSTSVHCSDYLQQTLNDLMQLNPDDFIIQNDQQQQFSHHVLQDTNSETVEDVVCDSSNAGSNSKNIASSSSSNDNLQPEDLTGENNDATDTYYSHIYDCIVRDAYPEGCPESYRTALKKRARHYFVIDRRLYYSRKEPREVIIRKHQRQKILQKAHIESETGIHLGAKRMHEAINKTSFWRGMYMDIITFVRDCPTCSESFSGSHLQPFAQCKLNETHEHDNEGHLSASNDNLLDIDLEIRNRVWQKVVVKVCGPYPKTADDNEYLIAIVDPVSMWVCVKPTASKRNIKTVAGFIIKIFCLLGFAECCFIGFTTQELENLQQHCKGGMFESQIISYMFGNKCSKRSQTEVLAVDECCWSTVLLNDFVNCYPSDWDRKVQSFLHTYHVSTGCDSLTPFYKLHGRNPKFILEKNKENRTKDTLINKIPAVFSTREKSQNSVLQIQQKSCTEGAQQCETSARDDCPLLHRKFRRKIFAEGHQDNAGADVQTGSASSAEMRVNLANRNQQQKIVKINEPSEFRADVIACVKKLLESAKEKQRKRGKYHKYSPEIREQIAQYVSEKGAGEAARYFSEKLGRVVSESTVRNIFKLHSHYTPELKQEIGKYAMTFGVQAASDHFTQKLGRAIRLGIVHKFKRFYLSQIPVQLKKKIYKRSSNVSRKRNYSDELKEEIGSYAFKYTVGAAIRHYSRKLGYPITETVVRRYRKMYLQKTFEQQSKCKQKQELLSSQQKGEHLQHERAQQQTYLSSQENSVRNQMEQAFSQNQVHERFSQSTDAASAMQTINIHHSSVNDPQFSDPPNTIFPPPCEAAAVPSSCSSFYHHTNSVLDIQPYIQSGGTVVSSSLVFPSQFNHVVDNTPVSTDPSIPVQEYQHNELYSYYGEHSQQEDVISVSGNNYISSLQLPPLSHFSDAVLADKSVSTLSGTPMPRKQPRFHLPNNSSLASDKLVPQIHSVLSQTGDVLFQQEGIPHLTDTNTAIHFNSHQVARQNADDIIPTSKYSGDNCQLHTSPLCYSVSNVSTKPSTEYSVNTLFDDQNNTFLMPLRGDCNVSAYSKYNESKTPSISCPTAEATLNEVNSTSSLTYMSNKSAKSPVSASDITNGHSYSVHSPSTVCSLTVQSLEPVLTNVLQVHKTPTTLKSPPPVSTLNSQNSEQQSALPFVTSTANTSLTHKMLKTSITPTSLVEHAGTLHPQLAINMKPLTFDHSTPPADVPQKPVTFLSSSLLKEKQVDTSCTTYSSCSIPVLKETMCSSSSHPSLVQPPVNQPPPFYTVATSSSRTTTKSIACAHAITPAQEEKKKISIPLMYFSQSQLTEPPPLVAISHPKTSAKQSPSHVAVFPVASVTETFSAVDSVTKIPPLAVVSQSTLTLLNDSSPLQNSVITYQSHSSRKRSPAHQLDTAPTVSQHKKLKTLEALVISEESLDQRTTNQSKFSSSETPVHPVNKAIMLSVSSSSNTDHVKNRLESVQKKIPLLSDSSASLPSVNSGLIMQNHGTISQSSSLVVSHQMTPITEVTIMHGIMAQTKPNSVENIHNTTVSSSVKNINTLTSKQNLLPPACSVPHIVHPKIDSSSKIPELSNLSVTGTRPPGSTHSMQTLMTIPTVHSFNYITVTSSNTPVMNHVVTVPCSNTASNCTSTEGSGITSSSLATTKSGNLPQCYTSAICTNTSSLSGVTRISSGCNLSDGAITMYSGNATTSVSTTQSDINCSTSRSTSLDYMDKVSPTNTSASETATSSAVHSFLDNVPETCIGSAVVKLSNPTSNSKNSLTAADTTFSDKSSGSVSSAITTYTGPTYSSNISTDSANTYLSGNNSVRCKSSNGLSAGLVAGVSDITGGDQKSNTVATKNPHKKTLSKSSKGRGNYLVCSPELRAEMGRYAAEHGNQHACLYFKHMLGVEVPSSTMRTLRDKYLLKLQYSTFDKKVLNKEVTSLGYGQRGRPMRLGKYDDEVRQCIEEIVKTGQPVSSYLVIETARQVLMHYDPSLLEENGGNIKLNVTWAKSFLKRTGIRNNS